MFKKLLLFILLMSVMGACSQLEVEEDPSKTIDITLEDVETVITEQGYELAKETDLPSENVFIQELNGISPEVYNLEHNTLSVFVFPSASDRGKGIQRFEERTATVELTEHKAYEINNILVFYVSDDEKIQNRLFEALQKLPLQRETGPELIEQDWEPRDQFVMNGDILFSILPDPALAANKSYGYIINFNEPFETFSGKKMAIYSTHKDSGLQITIRPPKAVTEPSSGYEGLQRFTINATLPISGYWKFKVVLDGEVYGDVILYIPDKPEDENQDLLLGSNLKLVDFDYKDLAAELKIKGIDHKLPSIFPVKIIGYEIVEGNPNNPYAPKDIAINFYGENGVLFTLSSGNIDSEPFFNNNGDIKQEEISINGNKGIYMDGVICRDTTSFRITFYYSNHNCI
ncbi:hypothetical protein FZW96_21305 [Bacillus sp. BGMRC 2118]|nr:hypothetical protein FZW96_21305 [Bacillus sp. BGMRC 2118]